MAMGFYILLWAFCIVVGVYKLWWAFLYMTVGILFNVGIYI
jgi:hypothetical protein